MTGKEKETLVTVRGIVVPMRWAEDGSITAVGISGFDERDFLIVSSTELDHWLSLLREEIEVTGTVAGTDDGLKIIEVHDFRVIGKGDANEAG